MLHHADEQSPPPSLLAASQRPCRPKLSRARRQLIGASHRFGLLHYLQIFIHYLQCIGEQYSANGQRSIFAQMIWRPLGTGKRFHQHSTLISPRFTSLMGLRTNDPTQ
jgi:hypothetical protein